MSLLKISCILSLAPAGLAYHMFGSPRPNEYLTESLQGIPLINWPFDHLEQMNLVDFFTKSQ